MKNKYMIILIVISIISTIIALNVILRVENKIDKFEYIVDNSNLESNIAIMVYDEETKEYLKTKTIPVGNYYLNKNKTKCAGRGEVSNYDSSAGTIKFASEAADECYLYFDKFYPPLNLKEYIKFKYTGQGTAVGNGVLYLHDSTLENGAGDGSYRYAGIDPNNYLCFEGDTCDDAHKYRIIGLFGENIKVIKMTSVGNKVWNSSDVNTWDGSTMDTYLNGEWLTSFGYSDLIKDYDWHVGGHTFVATPKEMYDAEVESSPVVNRKVGLMYESDYGYGALNNYWTTSLNSYDDGAMNTDWLYLKSSEWTISRYSSYSNYALLVKNSGDAGYSYVTYGFASRPSFYLRPSVVYKGGTGTSGDPLIVASGLTASSGETIIASYKGQGSAAGENGVMYLHDSTLENGANDGSYRYAGTNPNNYVCFEGDMCSDENNLYRIVGVFNNQLKLVKYKDIGSLAWDSTQKNNWEGSSLETYLNGDYLTSLGTKKSLIDDSIWSVGALSIYEGTPKTIYDEEMKKSESVTRKIGLIYASDYAYAATNTNWATVIKEYSSAKDVNWLHTSKSQWPISHYGKYGMFILSSGYISILQLTSTASIYPSFYLKINTYIDGGTGTKVDPYIISDISK